MATIFELLGDEAAAPPTVAAETPGQFQRGLKSGLSGAYSQLESFAGGAGDALGADEFAARRFQAAQAAQAQAQADAPRVTSYQDVGNVRDAYDYVTGLVGQSVPQTAATVLGAMAGRTPAGRLLGAGGAGTPFEAGDVVQRQMADPVASQAGSPLERFGEALGAGGLSAAVQGIVPAAVVGKVAGAAVRPTVAGAAGDVLKNTVAEGAAEAAGEAVKQAPVMLANPDKALDVQALKEAFVGGAAAGAPLAAVGGAADLAHGAIQTAAETPTNVLAGVKDAVGGAADAVASRARDLAAPGGPGAADEAPTDPVDRLRGLYDEGSKKLSSYWDRVAAQEDVADLGRVAGQGVDRIKELMPEIDGERVQRVTDAATELMEKAGLSEDRRAQLSAAMGDLTDRGNQALVATLKKGNDATQALGTKAKALAEAFKGKAAAAGAAKKSEDFSGVRAAIAKELVPALKRANPDIFEDHAALKDAAEAVRLTIDHFAKNGKSGMSSDQVARLIDTFGDETVNVLDATYRAIGGTDPAERESFYGALNEVQARKKDEDKTLGLMMRSLDPALQEGTKTSALREELKTLREWATTADRKTESGKFNTERVRFTLESRYGKNADKILEAVEKDVATEQSVLVDREEAAGMAEATLGDAVYYGPEKGGLAMNPDLDPAGDKGQARQAMARAEKQNPDRTVRFLTADELGHDHPAVQTKLKELQAAFVEAGKTVEEAQVLSKEAVKQYGMAAAEGKTEPGTITKDNVKAVRVKKEDEEKAKTSHLKQPSVFKADNAAYDAIALTKMIDQQYKGEYTDTDKKGAAHRSGRMFMAGIAALQDHLGKSFPIPDTLVIDHAGTTVADVKKLGFAPPNKAGEILEGKLAGLRKKYAEAKTDAARDAIRQEASDLVDEAKAADPRMDTKQFEGEATEADPFGNVHAALKGKDDGEGVNTNLDGSPREVSKGPTTKDEETVTKSGPAKTVTADLLREKFDSWVKNPPSAAAKAVAERGLALLDNKEVLNASGKKALAALLTKGTKPSDVASTVNALYEKHKGKIEPAPKAEAKTPDINVDRIVTKEDYEALDTPEKTDAFMVAAAKRYVAIRDKLKALSAAEDYDAEDKYWDENREVYGRLAEMFERGSSKDLASYYPDFGQDSKLKDADVRAMIAKAVPEVAAEGPKAGSAKASQQGVGTGRLGPGSPELKAIRAYIDKVLGPSIKTTLANIPHAGEFVNDTVRISVHALNPMSVAYHEALHGFFSKLAAQGNNKVSEALSRAATSAPIQAQLRRLLAGEQAALAQLRDPEEAAAYMYQFWAAGQLTVGDSTLGFFNRLKKAVLDTLGMWSKNRRAEVIMEYFHSGDFKTQGMGQPNAVAAALIDAGRNQALDKARAFMQPLADIADSLTVAGGQRLRDTGVPALRELADLMKATGRDGGASSDPGFLPAARTERTRVLNEFAEKMRGFTQAQIDNALQGMQSGQQATTPEGRLIQRAVQGKGGLLQTMLAYMQAAGVDTKTIQPDASYFPRKYDAAYISANRAAFEAVLVKHGVPQKEAEAITRNLAATDGAEFSIPDVDRPGMQNLKKRKIDIPDSELAPFMSKDLFEIMSSYVTQATRRAEWARRIGDDPDSISHLLLEAKRQGATKRQLEMAREFVRGADGTLGDNLNPSARRIMGNVLVYQNIRLLPMAIFSSIVDPMGIMVRGGTVTDAWDTFKRGVKEMRHAWAKEYPVDAETRLAETMGVIDDAMLAHTTSALYTQGMVGSTAKKVNDAFFRFNLMEGFSRSMRVGATQAAIKFLERHQDGTASPHSMRWLNELGLQPGFNMDLTDPAVIAAINQWVDGAILRPDAADKPIWMNDPHWMLISHLKQFVYSFQETILKRVAHEAKNGNYTPAMALTSYVPVMIAADMLKGLLQGGGELPQWKKGWGAAEYVGAGIERAGLLGAGQFALDLGMLPGPSIEQLTDVAAALDGKAPAASVAFKALPANAVLDIGI